MNKILIVLCLALCLTGCGAEQDYFNISKENFVEKLQENEVFEVEYVGNEDSDNEDDYFYLCNDAIGTVNFVLTENKDKKITKIFISYDEYEEAEVPALFAVVAEKTILTLSPNTDPNDFSEKYKTLESQQEMVSGNDGGINIVSQQVDNLKTITFTK